MPVDVTRPHIIASPFGTIHERNYTLPRPLGTAWSEPMNYVLAGLDTSNAEITGSIRQRVLRDIDPGPPPGVAPRIERRLKGDRLVVDPQPDVPPVAEVPPPARKGDRLDTRTEVAALLPGDALPERQAVPPPPPAPVPAETAIDPAVRPPAASAPHQPDD